SASESSQFVYFLQQRGGVYKNMGNKSKAFEFIDGVHKRKENVLPSNHSDLVCSHHNMGCFHEDIREYRKASQFYQRVYALVKVSLPPNYPNLVLRE
ncbi:unnamed protein product, partial [Rotaria socialis]